jgi:predicted Zn-dependent peptidase
MRWELSWHKEVLLNGLAVLLYPRPRALTAQMSLCAKYVSNDDSEYKIGTTHLLEHMLAGGSQERIRLLHQIERSGGCSYFETVNEDTLSSLYVNPERIVEAWKVFSALFFGKDFEDNKLEL